MACAPCEKARLAAIDQVTLGDSRTMRTVGITLAIGIGALGVAVLYMALVEADDERRRRKRRSRR